MRLDGAESYEVLNTTTGRLLSSKADQCRYQESKEKKRSQGFR